MNSNSLILITKFRHPWEREDYCGRPDGCGRDKKVVKKVDKKVDKKVTPIMKEQAKTLSF